MSGPWRRSRLRQLLKRLPTLRVRAMEDLIVREQLVKVAHANQGVLANPVDPFFEISRDVPGDPAGPEVGVHQPVAGDLFKKIKNIFSFAEAVSERRCRIFHRSVPKAPRNMK